MQKLQPLFVFVLLTFFIYLSVTNYQVASFACTDVDAGVNAEMVCATSSAGFAAAMSTSSTQLLWESGMRSGSKKDFIEQDTLA